MIRRHFLSLAALVGVAKPSPAPGPLAEANRRLIEAMGRYEDLDGRDDHTDEEFSDAIEAVFDLTNELGRLILERSGADIAWIECLTEGQADYTLPQIPFATVREGSTLYMLLLAADCDENSHIHCREYVYGSHTFRPVVLDLDAIGGGA